MKDRISVAEPHATAFAAGRIDAPRRIVVLHGYTGSPSEFHRLAQVLADRLDARVIVPLLPGHGTHEESLLRISFTDLVDAARGHVRRAAQGGYPLAIVGHSFGGYLAALAKDEAPQCRALVLTVVPYVLRFPFSVPLLSRIMRLRRFWSKPLRKKEEALRRQAFFYLDMPGTALTWVHEANRRMKAALRGWAHPLLTIGTDADDIVDPGSAARLVADSNAGASGRAIILPGRGHELFLDGMQDEVIALIADFLDAALRGEA